MKDFFSIRIKGHFLLCSGPIKWQKRVCDEYEHAIYSFDEYAMCHAVSDFRFLINYRF